MSFRTSSRVLAVGDLHGDVELLRTILFDVDVVNEDDEWIAGEVVVVLMGDFIYEDNDRRPHTLDERNERGMVAFIDALRWGAQQAGGRVLVLIGNHEYQRLVAHHATTFPAHMYGVVRVNDVVFAHGGLNESLLRQCAQLLPGVTTVDQVIAYANEALRRLIRDPSLGADDPFIQLFYANMKTSLVWDRSLSACAAASVCPSSQDMVVDHLTFVVAHTIQQVSAFRRGDRVCAGSILARISEHARTYEFKSPAISIHSLLRGEGARFVPNVINFTCDGRVWRVDAGMSRMKTTTFPTQFPQALCFGPDGSPSVFICKTPLKQQQVAPREQTALLRSFIRRIQARVS